MATMRSTIPRSAAVGSQRAVRPARVQLNTKAFLGMLNPSKERTAKKEKLLSMIKPLDRGIAAGPEERLAVEKIIRSLEGMNPTPQALKSDLVNGKWELLYTTNTNIIGGNRPAIFRPSGAFYQTIDAPNGKVLNQETSPYFNTIDAEITPVTKSRVDVTFKKLHLLGLIPLTAPEWMKGWLDVTYLDEEIRISRGDLGNVFVLRRAD